MSSAQSASSRAFASAVRRAAVHGAALVATLLLAGVALAACDGSDEAAAADGKVRIVYNDGATKPENRAVAEVIRKSGVLEQFAAWVNATVALPRDLTVRVTDKVPPGVSDAVTQPYGGTIFIPPAFVAQIHEANSNIVKSVERPALFPADKFNADDLTVLSTEFIFGHELGHALQRQLQLANLGLEEDAADGFASFYTLNEVGPDPSMAAALLFDEIARQEGELTLEGFSSNHPVTQQRVFNFLCMLDGSNPQRYDDPLIGAGYLPETRAPLCPTEWTALNYGWWTQLQPYFTETFADQGNKEQEQAHAEHVAATKEFAKELDQLRTAQ